MKKVLLIAALMASSSAFGMGYLKKLFWRDTASNKETTEIEQQYFTAINNLNFKKTSDLADQPDFPQPPIFTNNEGVCALAALLSVAETANVGDIERAFTLANKLKKMGANLEQKNTIGNTVLMVAEESSKPRATNWCLGNGSKVKDVRNQQGDTPLSLVTEVLANFKDKNSSGYQAWKRIQERIQKMTDSNDNSNE